MMLLLAYDNPKPTSSNHHFSAVCRGGQ